jgi:hypothetical protein
VPALGVHYLLGGEGERTREPMTTEQKIIKTKVGVLELAKQLGNATSSFSFANGSVSRNVCIGVFP